MSKRNPLIPQNKSIDCDPERRRVLLGGTALAAWTLVPRWANAQNSGAYFDYYISPTGSNNNPGTQSQPWALSALSTKPAIAGKRIGLLDGTYVTTSTDFQRAG